ncbi:hypothetical protein [Enterobacter hormaechei]|uniref:hypothetical protein n=1 Tax=Enterobacter hormaechei TaxID=158836 RepID=UPI0023B1A814|nr:hypothetical protein [Enterobacter hormaechei]MDE7845082.1 hypothetical protein [Enterobacter hormaechei]
MITITQNEYDAATILSNALKKYNGIISRFNIFIDVKNKSLQKKVEQSYLLLQSNNKLEELGFLKEKRNEESEVVKIYFECKNNFTSLCKLCEEFPANIRFRWGGVYITIKDRVSNDFFDSISKIDMEEITKVMLDSELNKFHLKEIKSFDSIDDRFLIYLIGCALTYNENSFDYFRLLDLHMQRYKINSLIKYFRNIEGYISAMIELDFNEKFIFNELDSVKDEDKHTINFNILNCLYTLNSERTIRFYENNKKRFYMSFSSEGDFNQCIKSIDSEELKTIYTIFFIVKNLEARNDFNYIKKMMKKLSEENLYKVNKEMLEYCKDEGRDYSSYEKEVIKYELKLNAVESIKTKRRF